MLQNTFDLNLDKKTERELGNEADFEDCKKIMTTKNKKGGKFEMEDLRVEIAVPPRNINFTTNKQGKALLSFRCPKIQKLYFIDSQNKLSPQKDPQTTRRIWSTTNALSTIQSPFLSYHGPSYKPTTAPYPEDTTQHTEKQKHAHSVSCAPPSTRPGGAIPATHNHFKSEHKGQGDILHQTQVQPSPNTNIQFSNTRIQHVANKNQKVQPYSIHPVNPRCAQYLANRRISEEKSEYGPDAFDFPEASRMPHLPEEEELTESDSNENSKTQVTLRNTASIPGETVPNSRRINTDRIQEKPKSTNVFKSISEDLLFRIIQKKAKESKHQEKEKESLTNFWELAVHKAVNPESLQTSILNDLIEKHKKSIEDEKITKDLVKIEEEKENEREKAKKDYIRGRKAYTSNISTRVSMNKSVNQLLIGERKSLHDRSLLQSQLKERVEKHASKTNVRKAKSIIIKKQSSLSKNPPKKFIQANKM